MDSLERRQNSSSTPPSPTVKGRVSRAAWHFIVDVVLLLLLLVLVGASSVLQFAFPAATQADGWTLWGWDYDRWSELRFGSLCGFLVIALIHLMLQWNWVCSFVTTRVGRIRNEKIVIRPAVRTLYGVSTLIAVLSLLGLWLAAAIFTVRPPR